MKNDWRERIDKYIKDGELVEKFTREVGLHYHHCAAIRPDWWPPTLDIITFGSEIENTLRKNGLPIPKYPSIDWFRNQVLVVTDTLGEPPAKCAAVNWVSEPGTSLPDLVARWEVEYDNRKLEVVVRVLSPTQCRIDPRTPMPSPEECTRIQRERDALRDARQIRLHPECAASIEELCNDVGLEKNR